jgi:hypothetical protein
MFCTTEEEEPSLEEGISFHFILEEPKPRGREGVASERVPLSEL